MSLKCLENIIKISQIGSNHFNLINSLIGLLPVPNIEVMNFRLSFKEPYLNANLTILNKFKRLVSNSNICLYFSY